MRRRYMAACVTAPGVWASGHQTCRQLPGSGSTAVCVGGLRVLQACSCSWCHTARHPPPFAGRCPSSDDPSTVSNVASASVETHCAYKSQNGAQWHGAVYADTATNRQKSRVGSPCHHDPAAETDANCELPPGVPDAATLKSQLGVLFGAEGNACHVDCSNRGTCDHTSGTCECFRGYAGPDCGTINVRAA